MKKVLLACLLALLLAVSATPVFADGDGGRIIFGESFTLESGERMDGDLVVLGGSVVLERRSRVDGNVVVMGGSARVAGEVNGDVVTFGGDVVLRSTAVVDGDLVTIGGNVQREPGAVVRGNEVGGFEFEGLPRFWTFPTRLSFGRGRDLWSSFIFDVFKAIFVALALAALGLLVVLFWPKQMSVVGQAILAAPLPSAGVGLLTGVVAVVLMVLLAITICLSPVAFLLFVATLVAGIFGWIAVGLLVGQRLLEAFKVRGVTSLMAVAAGTLLISLLRAIPCLGAIMAFVVGCAGLGAVVLTRFGTQTYPLPKRVPPAPPVPAPPEEIAAEEVEPEAEEVEPETEEGGASGD
ncbi:MAG: polymer-forming cytoskeletal protein [Anaerolineae bacterium]